MARETTVTGRKGALRPARLPVMRGTGYLGGHGEHWHLKRDAYGRYRSTARENPGGAWWIFGVVAAGAAVIGGIAYAASRPSGGGKKAEPGPKFELAPPAGYAWLPVQLTPQDPNRYLIPQGQYVLMEWFDDKNDITALANWLGSSSMNVYKQWDRGTVPPGWPGSSDPKLVRFYALANANMGFRADTAPQFRAYSMQKVG